MMITLKRVPVGGKDQVIFLKVNNIARLLHLGSKIRLLSLFWYDKNCILGIM